MLPLQMPTTPDLGRSGEDTDLRSLVSQTVARLTSTRCSRSVTTYKTLNTLQNAVTMASSKAQRRSNKLGDSYSKPEGRLMLGKIASESDKPVEALKVPIEELYLGRMATASRRSRQARAHRESARGFVFFADNLDWVSR